MLNQFTLYFNSAQIETEYRQYQTKTIKQEYTIFMYQAVSFMVFYMFYYFDQTSFNHRVLAVQLVFIVVIICFKFIIDKNTASTLVILPALQWIFAILWNLDPLMPCEECAYNQEYDPDAAYQYNWYYGFQAYYFHIAILNQGYHLMPQSISLVGIHLWYITYYPTKTLEYTAICLTLTSVFLGMFLIKYTNEKTKRMQFIDFRERSKWNYIIDEVLDQSIMLIKMDAASDQLKLHQINRHSQTRLLITKDQEMRSFLRDAKLTNSLQTSPLVQQNLENIIRSQILNKQQKQNLNTEVYSSKLKQIFHVKIMQYVFNDQEMVIVVFGDTHTMQIKQMEMEICAKQLIFCEAQKVLISSIVKPISRIQICQAIAIDSLSKHWLLNDNVILAKSKVPCSYISKLIRNYFGQKTKVINQCSELMLNISCKVLMLIILGLTSFIGTLSTVTISSKFKFVLTQIKIKMSFQTVSMQNESFVNLLLHQNISFQSNDWRANQTIIYEFITRHSKNKNLKLLQLLILIMCKFLLWQYFGNSQIPVKRKQNQLHYYLIFML